MKTIIELISQRIADAIQKVTGQNISAIVTAATDPRFGDYQSNNALSLAKQLKANPRQLAEKIIAELMIDDICQTPEIAGAGFINLRLKSEFIKDYLSQIKNDTENFGIEKSEKSKTVVVDFSGPNIAKQMHVGHLRSTIIGDCICRMLSQAGSNVIPQNHIGDWGLQMGMLIAISDDLKQNNNSDVQHKLDTLENTYKLANQKFKDDPSFADKSRKSTYNLQNHEFSAINQWQNFRKITLDACNEIYKYLSVGLNDDNIRGESFYTDKLSAVVNDLKNAGLAVESEGAVCVFPEGFKTKEGNPMPFIIQKTDGAFLYATTDLAALRFRINELHADEIIYVTDARQKLHFEMLFKVAEIAGWKKNTKLVHVTFGSVLGEDGKPLKTRSGENVKLKELLDEAVKRAKQVVEDKNPDLPENEKEQIARAVGIGAVKYADYSNNRTSDYIFSFDKMLAMDGNTAPYMQYAYARVKSIGRKGQEKGIDTAKELSQLKEIILSEPAEFELAKQIIRYSEAFSIAISDFKPNFLTAYLYDLAGRFSAFYNACPVLDAEPNIRASRLLLCELTAQIIRHGLENLLGIKIIDRM
ncbi:MAG: Arginine--tRNA ligase [Planctomycetes bacterium ADurb.Bin401]|nr:MAG: Arginine--tRNA ligase [Planctomycetes bacterium ADurb.Bin401]